MKIIGRILIILAAALVVVGITMAIGNSLGAALAAPARPDGLQFQQPPEGGEAFVPGQRPDGNFEEREEGRGFSFGWVKNIIVIALIVIVFLAGERVWNIIRRQKISLIQKSD